MISSHAPRRRDSEPRDKTAVVRNRSVTERNQRQCTQRRRRRRLLRRSRAITGEKSSMGAPGLDFRGFCRACGANAPFRADFHARFSARFARLRFRHRKPTAGRHPKLRGPRQSPSSGCCGGTRFNTTTSMTDASIPSDPEGALERYLDSRDVTEATLYSHRSRLGHLPVGVARKPTSTTSASLKGRLSTSTETGVETTGISTA